LTIAAPETCGSLGMFGYAEHGDQRMPGSR
jgi:hypothetical protein